MKKYDVAVIGGGPGGYVAAIRAADMEQSTVLVEADKMGGTCLNRGCIPTKALLHSGEVYAEMKSAKKLGIKIGDIEIDYKKIAKRKDKVVTTLRSGIENLVKGHGVEVVNGKAKFTGRNTFVIEGNDEEIYAENIILATGSIPALIPIQGAELPGVLDSTDVLELSECPESVTIIGGGVIGVEFATLFNSLGKEVTIIEMMPSILYGNDSDVCRSMTELLQDKGVNIHTNAKVLRIENGLTTFYESENQEGSVVSEIVIMAVGRKPNTESLNLAATGVDVEKGFISVDSHMRTNVENIYAIGDITGKVQLAHVASAQGMVAVENITGGNSTMKYEAIPGCIYTSPEIATVGLSEEKAEEQGYDISVGTFSVMGNGRSMAINCSDGFAKLIVDKSSDKILGCHIIAPHATEMISEVVTAIDYGITASQLGDVVHPHPTVSEIIMEAAHDVHGKCCHKM